MSKSKKKKRTTQKVTIITPEVKTTEFVPFEYEKSTNRKGYINKTKPMAALHYSNTYKKYTKLALNKATGELLDTLNFLNDTGEFKINVSINKNTNEILITPGDSLVLKYSVDGTHFRYSISNTDFCNGLYKVAETKKFNCKIYKDEGLLLEPIKEA